MKTFNEFFELNEGKGFEDFKKAWKSHDFYYDMSDDSRKYSKGEKSEKALQSLYVGLSAEDKELADEYMMDYSKGSRAHEIITKRFTSL